MSKPGAMIPCSAPACQTDDWQKQQAEAIRDPEELLRELALPMSLLPAAKLASEQFPLRVPRDFVARMQKGNPADPLLLQVLPLADELQPAPAGYAMDPVGDGLASPVPGLLHKYHGRALLISTAACAVHCRYCFRRHFPYSEQRLDKQWQEVLDYLQAHPHIDELILSGGDPLSLTNPRLENLLQKFRSCSQLKRLRIHTRQPIVLPARVDTGLLALLGSLPWQVIIVVHANHPRELDATVQRALAGLHQRGFTLLNQSVLLAGVNDHAETLIKLSERLFECHVLPYYLHQLDRVQGAQHFEVMDKTAIQLVEEMRGKLPGYLVPRLVREVSQQAGKSPVC